MPVPTSVVHVPDGLDVDAALARTTDLGIGAHPDDLELDLLPGVVHCVDDPDRWFTGIVCTDGAGSVRVGASATMTDDELVAERWAEQRRAADHILPCEAEQRERRRVGVGDQPVERAGGHGDGEGLEQHARPGASWSGPPPSIRLRGRPSGTDSANTTPRSPRRRAAPAQSPPDRWQPDHR